MDRDPNPRIFTFEEARDLLPRIRERTRGALESIEELAALDMDERAPDELQRKAEHVLTSWARDVERLGISVKGPWLVDFDSGAGYYCWRWPEESLEFFHGYDEGFAGRVPLQ